MNIYFLHFSCGLFKYSMYHTVQAQIKLQKPTSCLVIMIHVLVEVLNGLQTAK
jgi:hypothetical protein